MTTTTEAQAQVDFALAMDDEPPCVFSLVDDCTMTATWMAYVTPHPETCSMPPALPMCNTHMIRSKKAEQLTLFFGASKCVECGVPFHYSHFEPIERHRS